MVWKVVTTENSEKTTEEEIINSKLEFSSLKSVEEKLRKGINMKLPGYMVFSRSEKLSMVGVGCEGIRVFENRPKCNKCAEVMGSQLQVLSGRVLQADARS